MPDPLSHFAVISDLHSNLEALTAVFRDIHDRGIKTVVCLGDIVGYGPDPKPCVDIVRKYCALTIMGNHDLALFERPKQWNPYAIKAIKWTRQQLDEKKDAENGKRLDYLDGLRDVYYKRGIMFVHGSPLDPINEYLSRQDVYSHDRDKMNETLAYFDKICFVGHTHLPSVITAHAQYMEPSKFDHIFEFSNVKIIVNVGSVGQPRDRDNRASFVEYKHPHVMFHRVEYDYKTTREKVHAIAALDKILGDRLADGV